MLYSAVSGKSYMVAILDLSDIERARLVVLYHP